MNEMKSKRVRATLGALLIALLCTGCEVGLADKKPDPAGFRCNSAQLELVKEETEICGSTDYFSSYCFAQAKSTHCEKINSNDT